MLPYYAEFAAEVTEKGIAVTGRDYAGLARGLMVLMMRIEPVCLCRGEETFRIACCHLEGKYETPVRMIHFCVFPETSFVFLKKCVRLAGVMQYTHVVLEYWGMLQYDCLKELAWPNAFSKKQAAEIVRETEDLGMEAVPMFNHLGHAAACRVSGGKHVVLDQNPSLATLFSPDGWSWNIFSRESAVLLGEIRKELYELYPHATFFHLGCDEVYSYENDAAAQFRMRTYLNETLSQVHAEGKRPVIWGDMLLNRNLADLDESYFCSCEKPEDAIELLKEIPDYTLIGDWQYNVFGSPVKSSLFFKENGFDVLGVSWLEAQNYRAHIDTVRDCGLMGTMISTWHTLGQKMPQIVAAAIQLGAFHSPWSGNELLKIETETATLLRKVCFVEGNYKEAGWTDSQVFLQARPME